MPWKANVLVVANVTADSDELFAALRATAERGPTHFELLVPASWNGTSGWGGASGRERAAVQLAAALERARVHGLELEGSVGDPDPLAAVQERFDPRTFDAIIISTLPTGASKWLQIDLPHRVERLTDVPVTHVVATERRPPAATTAAPEHDRSGVLKPLNVLTWGGPGKRRPAA